MFYYFGRKGRLAGSYPLPKHPLVIEPFAGSMAYTLHYKPEKAIGMEINKEVHDVWHKICSLLKEEILNYHEPKQRDEVNDRWAMMAGGSHGTTLAKKYLWTERMERDLKKQKKMAAKHVDYARTIDYRHGTYQDCPDVEATWFIDPPYQHVKRGYVRDKIDYKELAEWCKNRKGQVIVCDQKGADWLPFQPFKTIKGTNNKESTEVIWTNWEWCNEKK